MVVDVSTKGFGRIVDRNVDIAVAGDLAARRVERQRVALLVLEEAVPVGVDLRRDEGGRRSRYMRYKDWRGAGLGGSSVLDGGFITLVDLLPQRRIFAGQLGVVFSILSSRDSTSSSLSADAGSAWKVMPAATNAAPNANFLIVSPPRVIPRASLSWQMNIVKCVAGCETSRRSETEISEKLTKDLVFQ